VYLAKPFEQQQFKTIGVEGVNFCILICVFYVYFHCMFCVFFLLSTFVVNKRHIFKTNGRYVGILLPGSILHICCHYRHAIGHRPIRILSELDDRWRSYDVMYLIHRLISVQNFTEIVIGGAPQARALTL